jgi:ABC-type glycerol-3-phosphate transport system permease component
MRKSIRSEIFKHAFVVAILVVSFFPLYLMLTISFKDNSQFLVNPWYPQPPFHLENWVKGWMVVKNYIFNTVFVAITAVAFTFCFTLPGAFFFARYKVPLSRFFWYFFLILMLMPGVANLVPLFMLLKKLSLLNSLFALIIVGASGAQVVQIYVLRNFIEDIPSDLFEAAEIDGAGPVKQIWNVVLPLSGSIISTLAILQFIGVWNDFILPMVVIRDDSLLTLAAGLVKLDGEYVKMWGEMMAGYSIASIPLVVLFIFTMRLFVKGLSAGAIKG